VTPLLVSAAWLRERLGEAALRVVDCRYRLGEPRAGEALYRGGHIPGAAFLDLDRDLAAQPGERGRHPLPDHESFETAARRAGVGRDTLVVAYDEAAEGGAARLWWLLRHFGHDRVTVLDGGLRGWRDEGGDLRAGDERIEPGDFRAATPKSAPASAEHSRSWRAPGRGTMQAAARTNRHAARSSSTRGRPSAIAARPSPSTRSPDASRVR
jgi:3-mercaptopyruvate sulfurtransferase SseA